MQMPYLYLSPSTQQFNPYVTTGNEEYWMNQLADRMEPYLLASGIEFNRRMRQRRSGNPMKMIMICIWRCIPTPRRRVRKVPIGESTPIIIPAVPTACEWRRFWWII